jgi:hypothetical protein
MNERMLEKIPELGTRYIVIFVQYNLKNKVKDDERIRTYRAHDRKEESVQKFGCRTGRKENTIKPRCKWMDKIK